MILLDLRGGEFERPGGVEVGMETPGTLIYLLLVFYDRRHIGIIFVITV
jgi:hypothetical protein